MYTKRAHVYTEVSQNEDTWGYPKMDGLEWTILLIKRGYPYSRKPPYIYTLVIGYHSENILVGTSKEIWAMVDSGCFCQYKKCVYTYIIYIHVFFKYIQYITFLEWSRSSETMEIPKIKTYSMCSRMSIYLSIYPSIHLSIYPSLDLSMYRSTFVCIISPYITRYCKWPVFSTTQFSDVRSGWPWPQCVVLGRHVFAQNQLGWGC